MLRKEKTHQFILVDKKPSTADSIIVDLNAGGIYWRGHFHFIPKTPIRIILAMQIVDRHLTLKDIVGIAWHDGYINYCQERSAQVAIIKLNKILGHELVKRQSKRSRNACYRLNP